MTLFRSVDLKYVLLAKHSLICLYCQYLSFLSKLLCYHLPVHFVARPWSLIREQSSGEGQARARYSLVPYSYYFLLLPNYLEFTVSGQNTLFFSALFSLQPLMKTPGSHKRGRHQCIAIAKKVSKTAEEASSLTPMRKRVLKLWLLEKSN